MFIIRTIKDLRVWRQERAKKGLRIGMVPTMGYLHEGHLSLVREAAKHSDLVLMSIFVNPLQFGPNEDLTRYPRNEARDLAMAEQAGVDAVFLPTPEEMYPEKPLTHVVVGGVSEGLCGASRPGHFDGVAFVVLKLFMLAQPDVACFGMKDAQQVAVIQQLVNDLAVPVEIVPCPLIREADGLAMSSRNVYLNDEERSQAPIISKALGRAEQIANAQHPDSELTINGLLEIIRDTICEAPLAQIDYLEIRTFPGWRVPDGESPIVSAWKEPFLIAAAVRFGKTRLIDNTILHVRERRDNHV